MMLSLIESLRRLVRQDLNRLTTPVGNFHGAVAGATALEQEVLGQSWLRLTTSGSQLLTADEFYRHYNTTPESTTTLELASQGEATVAIPVGQVALLRTVLTSARQQTARLELQLEGVGSRAGVYLDGVLLRTVQGVSAVPLVLSPGTHTLAVVAQAPRLLLRLPSALSFAGTEEVLAVPQWRQVTTGYLDAQNGTVANTLDWAAVPDVGGYRIFRRRVSYVSTLSAAVRPVAPTYEQPTTVRPLWLPSDGLQGAAAGMGMGARDGDLQGLLGELDGLTLHGMTMLTSAINQFETVSDGQILEVGPLGNDNTFVLRLAGNQTGRLDVGMPLLCQRNLLGYVVRADLVDGATEIVLRAATTAPATLAEFVGAVTYTGALVEIARVPATTAPDMQFQDTNVTAGELYEYALQAYSALDGSRSSALSELVQIQAGDTQPPGVITLLGTPTVLDRRVTVRFTTPTDTDYQGVRVYWRGTITNAGAPFTVQSVVGNVVTVQAGSLPTIPGYTVQFSGSTTRHTVTTNSTTSLTLSPAPAVVATGTQLAIFTQELLKTDYGSPGRDDELSFDATQYGQYVFATFDRSDNEQTYGTATKWTYSETADRFSGPPILMVRQLTTAEQDYFTAYKDPVRYAILEVYAYDPLQTSANKLVGVTIKYQRVGVDANPVALSPVPAGDFPNLVESGVEAILDAPGTRSRFILVDRQTPRTRLWAENALGLSSDQITFVADLDVTPNVTVDTYTNPLIDAAEVRVVADDDTMAVTWQVDNGTVTTIDTRTLKTPPPIVIPLALGESKRVTVTPHGSFPTTASSAGPAVVRDLVRTPRSYVTVDSKDENGMRSATTATLTFTMAPPPAIVASGTGAVTSIPTGGFLFTPTPAVSWAVNQFQNYCYLVLRAGGAVVAIEPIASNTATALTVTSGLTVGTYTYEIRNGAVLWRRITDASASATKFIPTAGTETIERLVSCDVEFYATRQGSLPENVRRITVDADAVPSLSSFAYQTVTEGSTTYLVLGFGSADDDATTWEVYEKKGGWPTRSGAQPSSELPTDSNVMDPTYLRFAGSVAQSSYRRSMAGMTNGDVWYAVAIPKNSFGQAGIAATATHTVNGAAPTVPALTDLTLTPNVSGNTVTVSWSTNEATVGSETVNLSAFRVGTSGSEVTAQRSANQTYALNVGEIIVSANGTPRTWSVTASLGSSTFTRTVQFLAATTPPGTGLVLTANASVFDLGQCGQNGCWDVQSRGHSRLVTWTLTENNQPVTPASPYFINIDVSNTFATPQEGEWVTVVFGLRASDQSWYDASFCEYSDGLGGPNPTYWRYRLTVTDGSGTPIAPAVQAVTTRIQDVLRQCGTIGPAF